MGEFAGNGWDLITLGLQSETLKYLFLLFSDGDTIPLSSEWNNVRGLRNHAQPVFAWGVGRIRFQHRGETCLPNILIGISSLNATDLYRRTRCQYLRRLFELAFPDCLSHYLRVLIYRHQIA